MEGKPIILFECKRSGGELNISHASQLFRYFHVTDARFGVLTNGLVYKFFTDLKHPNKMDERPFFEFNILDFKVHHVEELKKFTKSTFDIDQILTTASYLKYTRAVMNLLSGWMKTPSDDLVKIICSEVHNGKRFTPALKEQFTQIIKDAFNELVAERITERLKMAMEPNQSKKEINESDQEQDLIQTTQEELESFHIIRAILCETIDPKRIVMRDAKSYCAILFDDNNRKPICGLRMNNTLRLALGLFDEKEEKIVQINSTSEIYKFSAQIKNTVSSYLSEEEK